MEQYFARFGGVRDYLHEVVDQARKDGYTSTVFGRRRYLPELDSSNRNVREAAERAALNAPIQGSAADIIKVAMINVDTGAQGRRPEVADAAAGARRAAVRGRRRASATRSKKLVRDQMGNAYPLDVPLEVSVGYGRSWDSRRALVSSRVGGEPEPQRHQDGGHHAFDAPTNMRAAQ